MKKGIIAFCGAKFSGKSTSADIFKGLTKVPYEEKAFAGHLKWAASVAFGVDIKYFLDPSLKEVELETYVVLGRENLTKFLELFDLINIDYDKYIRKHCGQIFYTGRSLLQHLGTDVLHPIDPLIHVNITLKNKDPNKLTIITDLRFPHEFDALNIRNDYVPVYVSNTSAENNAVGDTHASEQGWKKFKNRCRVLDNNGTLQNLNDGINKLIGEMYE